MKYEVGYGKPPHTTRFQKGHSGNPKGRPKKPDSSLLQYCDELERKKISLSGASKQKSRPAYEVGVIQLARKVSRGDPDAWSELAEAFKRHRGEVSPGKTIIIGGLPKNPRE
jgi:hypothetical protein